jgi:hypothetical protein
MSDDEQKKDETTEEPQAEETPAAEEAVAETPVAEEAPAAEPEPDDAPVRPRRLRRKRRTPRTIFPGRSVADCSVRAARARPSRR